VFDDLTWTVVFFWALLFAALGLIFVLIITPSMSIG